ncbi:TetR/AcrR family transcriptional regulator [Mycobacterium sp. ITM-2016-00317]|uniref:TetR family transcriptional regulator n=1 Tax=Mycobacterium sp. ITM-2016-00317 TaxID=2099694 RepID=UPI000D4E24E2|nr:TetR/AcrR family transcriptional regulator [Mycobacterium sp. ITM-2016-00317]WNG90502.1 TetR/AcrR family transcriptional regulator [Mycobacterium sp. ITM-2016-00317]
MIDLEPLLDAAEQAAAEAGPRAVTIRALSERTGISNGAIYHAFGSRGGLLGQVWLRAARRFLTEQRAAVADALPDGPQAAVVAAAQCPAVFLENHRASALYLLALPRGELIGARDVPAGLADELRNLDGELAGLLVELAEHMWGRRDRHAVAAIRACVVDLPTALLLRGQQPPDSAARERLVAAVRAVLTLTPPTTTPRKSTR